MFVVVEVSCWCCNITSIVYLSLSLSDGRFIHCALSPRYLHWPHIEVILFVQVRQYIHSVNGKHVLRWSHRQVADEILNSPNVVELVVMNHFRGS
jgi:hypothetical protein